jgi:hypothetical protein
MLALLICAGGGLAAEPQNSSDLLKPAPDLKAITDRLDQMDKKIQGLDAQQSLQVQVWADQFRRELSEIRELLTRLQRDVSDLKAGRSTTTESLKPADGKATLQLLNEHPWMNMDVVINGVTTTVPPMQTRLVTVPAGNVNFQVLQTDGFVRARVLPAGVIHQVTMR